MPVTIDSMEVSPAPAGQAQHEQANAAGQPAAITPELVRQVADRVYAALLEDLRLERERRSLLKGSRYGRY